MKCSLRYIAWWCSPLMEGLIQGAGTRPLLAIPNHFKSRVKYRTVFSNALQFICLCTVSMLELFYTKQLGCSLLLFTYRWGHTTFRLTVYTISRSSKTLRCWFWSLNPCNSNCHLVVYLMQETWAWPLVEATMSQHKEGSKLKL